MTATADALTLLQVPGVTPALTRLAIATFADAGQFLAAPPHRCPPPLAAIQRHYRADPDRYQAAGQRLAEQLAKQQIVPLVLGTSQYPRLLAEIHRPPPLLYVRGDPLLLSLPQLAIVGSRRASSGALQTAYGFAAELAACGLAITSGLALGVDGAAHQGAIESGKTVAVLGTGVDVCYPRQHRALAQQIIASGGALVSEFPLGLTPRRENFPQRNRIISGLSLGVLVVEAARSSGSLITARLAMEQNREVFAVPGSVHNPQARGCHQLIREGAALTETTADIVAELGGLLGGYAEELQATRVAATEAVAETPLLAAMGFDPVTLDTLVERTGQSIPVLTAALVSLELEGRVASQGGVYLRQR